MANGEDNIKSADREGDAGKVAERYEEYRADMERHGQKPKSLKDILGK